MNIKDYLKANLDLEIADQRKMIRVCKNRVKIMEGLKAEIRNKTEGELLAILETDEETKAEYEKIQKLSKEKSNSELKRMIETGVIREIHYDKDGNEIKLEQPGLDASSSQSEQSIDDSPSDG